VNAFTRPLLLLALCVACAQAVTSADNTNPSAASATGPIARSQYVNVDGARLFLQVRGDDRRAPVLLWLHGGPGGAERPLFQYFNSALEHDYVVAYLDQRGTARSFDADAVPGELTIDRHLADLDVIAGRLQDEFGKRVVLIGHSWGGALALLYAHAHPERVAAVIGVAPLVDTVAQQQAQHAFIAAEAERRNDRKTLERLGTIGPPPYRSSTDALAVEALADKYGAVYHTRPNKTWVMLSGIVRGLVTPWEIPTLIRGNNVSLAAMNEELLGLHLGESVPALDVPVAFFLGRHDHHVDAAVAADYFASLRAPAKHLVWFEHSAHNIPFEEPDTFVTSVVDALRTIGIDPASAPRA
jgi:pimeloyl-ACP methyl ester carboxylesterase